MLWGGGEGRGELPVLQNILKCPNRGARVRSYPIVSWKFHSFFDNYMVLPSGTSKRYSIVQIRLGEYDRLNHTRKQSNYQKEFS